MCFMVYNHFCFFQDITQLTFVLYCAVLIKTKVSKKHLIKKTKRNVL